MADTPAHAIRSILVPIDGTPRSDQALPFALAIAGAGGAVTLLEVVPESEALGKPFGSATLSDEEVATMLNELATDDLQKAASDWQSLAPAVSVNYMVGMGEAADAIMKTAKTQNSDLIALASAARGAIGRLALGSVSDKVMRESEIPVLVIRQQDDDAPRHIPAIGRIFVALDGSERSLLALPTAAALANSTGAEVTLLTAIDLPQVVAPVMGTAPAFSPEMYTQLEDESETAAQNQLAAAIAEIAKYGVTAKTQITVGFAVDSILAAVEPGDLIVMTSRGQGGFRRWIMGSVAERLVRDSPTAVVIVPAHHVE
jgi:nucleotide-binding universal stress UspA family protein